MPPASHALFKRYPLSGQVQLSTGPAPTPYHIYAGYGAFLSGTADLAAVRALLAPEQVQPLTTTSGQALMGVWVLDFTDASLGPHHEVQFSVFVARAPAPALPAHPLAVTQALLDQPEARMLCHGLWNSTARVVAYNREVLGLPARLCRSRLTRDGAALAFDAADPDTGRPIVSGRLRLASRASFRVSFALARRLGFGRSQRLATQPWVAMKVVNPLGLRPRHDAALACNHNDVNVLRYFDPRTDTLTVADEPYRALAFQPQVVQQMGGIKFVYGDPQPE